MTIYNDLMLSYDRLISTYNDLMRSDNRPMSTYIGLMRSDNRPMSTYIDLMRSYIGLMLSYDRLILIYGDLMASDNRLKPSDNHPKPSGNHPKPSARYTVPDRNLLEVFEKRQLYYWHREKSGSSAEVDYVIEKGGEVIPVEVKSGSTGKMQSLNLFIPEPGTICR